MDLDKVDSFLFFCTAYQQPNSLSISLEYIETVSFPCVPSHQNISQLYFFTYLDVVVQSGLGSLSEPYLKAFWSLWMQSAAKGWCFRDCRNLWTWGRRMLLGGKRPVHNHNSSQPFSSLYLHKKRPRRKKKITRGTDTSDLLCLTQFNTFGPKETSNSYLMWLSVSCLRVWQ